MQNIQERLTGLSPATGASSRRNSRFAVSISASLTAGLTTEGKKHLELSNGFLKKSRIFLALSRIFFQKLNMSAYVVGTKKHNNIMLWVLKRTVSFH